MWMDLVVSKNESSFKQFSHNIFVRVVNFDDSLFFRMPENRQQVCANAIFKRFIKWYKENYDGQLVTSNFSNYDLQEKFKLTCEKGIFPKESLELIKETSEENYLDDDTYNMNNRRSIYENKINIDGISFDDFVMKYYDIKEDDSMGSGEISNTALIHYDNNLNLEFEIFFNNEQPVITNNTITIDMDSVGLTIYDDFLELLKNNESLQSKFLEIFEKELNYVFYGNDEFYVEDFIEYLNVI